MEEDDTRSVLMPVLLIGKAIEDTSLSEAAKVMLLVSQAHGESSGEQQ